jgi:glucosyl-3-phosphoglycerate synthase
MAVVSIVVVPAHDEQDTIVACLEALASQTIPADAFETIVVADACSDETAVVARAAARRLGLLLSVIDGPGCGSGPARRLGMDAAADRLASLGAIDGVIATTDADSTPAADWLARQLDHVARGARVIAGLIELDRAGATLPTAVLRRREAEAARRLAQVRQDEPDAAHHHFAGASLGVTLATYREVGGLEPTAALEDEAFLTRLRRFGVPILYASDVVVRTSPRFDGRARRGLSVDLAVSAWRERRRYAAGDFSLTKLREAKRGTTVTVVIPTKHCEDTIAGVLERTVAPSGNAGLVDDVVVIDSGGGDHTSQRARASGARVVYQDAILPEYGPALGKGDAMWRALDATGGDVVCFLDGDTEDPHPHHLQGLIGPLLCEPSVALVKGAFERPLRSGNRTLANEGGRVTELTARPLLNLHFPLLAGFSQPLAGEFAARRDLLERLPLPTGYGVEIAILIDALRDAGLDALAECHLGSRQNRHQPLRALGEMAFAVLAAVEQRIDGPRSVTHGHYLKPWDDGTVVRVPIVERPPLRSRVGHSDRPTGVGRASG